MKKFSLFFLYFSLIFALSGCGFKQQRNISMISEICDANNLSKILENHKSVTLLHTEFSSDGNITSHSVTCFSTENNAKRVDSALYATSSTEYSVTLVQEGVPVQFFVSEMNKSPGEFISPSMNVIPPTEYESYLESHFLSELAPLKNMMTSVDSDIESVRTDDFIIVTATLNFDSQTNVYRYYLEPKTRLLSKIETSSTIKSTGECFKSETEVVYDEDFTSPYDVIGQILDQPGGCNLIAVLNADHIGKETVLSCNVIKSVGFVGILSEKPYEIYLDPALTNRLTDGMDASSLFVGGNSGIYFVIFPD